MCECILGGILWLTLVAAQEAPASAGPSAPRPDAVRATLRLSNGETLRGWLNLTPGKKLKVWDRSLNTYREFALGEMERIEVQVMATRTEREWYFKEEGNPEKVYTGRVYPRLDFSFAITLSDRRVVLCDIHNGQPLYLVQDDGTRTRFLLQPHLRGEIGQTARQVVHPKEILLGADSDEAVSVNDRSPKRAEEPSADTSGRAVSDIEKSRTH